MKKKIALFSLALLMILSLSMYGTALAAKPVAFSADGKVGDISTGDVFPAGASGRYVVAERQLSGILSGDINGDFVFTYKAAIKNLATQADNLHGKLVLTDGPVLNVNGRIEPLEPAGTIIIPSPDPPYFIEVPVFELTIRGKWTLLDGQGTGHFFTRVLFIPTPEGHVGTIIDSSVSLTGKWQP